MDNLINFCYQQMNQVWTVLKKQWDSPLASKIVEACSIVAGKRFGGGLTTTPRSPKPSQEAKTIPSVRQVVIIGSGPAGYTAATYAARNNMQPLVYEGSINGGLVPGGQLMSTTQIENYPGFPHGIEGPALMANLREQADINGAEMVAENVLEIDFSKRPFTIRGEKTHTQALAVIIATGAKANRLDIPGTRDGELWQHGVSACATCDGPLPLFRNRQIFVIGGGDTAMEEALFLSKFASKVFIVHRRDQLRASKAMQRTVFANPKIELLWNSKVTHVHGDKQVTSVTVQNVHTNEETSYSAGGLFFAVGHTPNTAFLKGQLKLNPAGYIEVKPGTTETSIPHVYAAGDVQDPIYRQAATAVGTGCMAAIQAERELNNLNPRGES
jgi:thioredoxin reductase (NADPH)